MDANPQWAHTVGLAPSTAESARWASLGPYYAMFPVAFARSVIEEHTSPGDGVLDPFAGRGTSLFCARQLNRVAFGAELNPLAWIYGRTKLRPASERATLSRLAEIAAAGPRYSAAACELPDFFKICFAPAVRQFLLAARSELAWKTRRTDRTLMAFILIYLHGKIANGRPSALSNQMRQTKAMAPQYSIDWWRAKGFDRPPEVDPLAFLQERIRWRYGKGRPQWEDEELRLGDCRHILRRNSRSHHGQFQLLLTSPPYRGVTSYYYDQWLRFWLLGEAPHPIRDGQEWKRKFEDGERYRKLLFEAFHASRRLIRDNGVVYVRTDARRQTLDVTKEALRSAYPEWRLAEVLAPYAKATQTSLFGDRAAKPGEVDLILTR